MIRLIFSEIRFMNGMFFSKARYMIGVGFKVLARTPLPKLPPSYPRVTPPPPPPPPPPSILHTLRSIMQNKQCVWCI